MVEKEIRSSVEGLYVETTREEPFNGKRGLEIRLISGEDPCTQPLTHILLKAGPKIFKIVKIISSCSWGNRIVCQFSAFADPTSKLVSPSSQYEAFSGENEFRVLQQCLCIASQNAKVFEAALDHASRKEYPEYVNSLSKSVLEFLKLFSSHSWAPHSYVVRMGSLCLQQLCCVLALQEASWESAHPSIISVC